VTKIVTQGLKPKEAYAEIYPIQGLRPDIIARRAYLTRIKCQSYEAALRGVGAAAGIMEHEEYVRTLRAIAQRAEDAGQFGPAVLALREAARACGLDQPQRAGESVTAGDLVGSIGRLLGEAVGRAAAIELGVRVSLPSPDQPDLVLPELDQDQAN